MALLAVHVLSSSRSVSLCHCYLFFTRKVPYQGSIQSTHNRAIAFNLFFKR
jgi:hypothetical protein